MVEQKDRKRWMPQSELRLCPQSVDSERGYLHRCFSIWKREGRPASHSRRAGQRPLRLRMEGGSGPFVTPTLNTYGMVAMEIY